MEKLIYNQIADEHYLGIVTMLDYETSLRKCLTDISIAVDGRTERKVIVDLALKTGLNKYRFVSYSVNDIGKILWSSSAYISPCAKIVTIANSIIKQKPEILSNSMLSSAAQEELMRR